MTGNKPNKQSGQVLLIMIMLLTTTLTVTMTNAFKSATDTKITKLEEDSQKALAAAEAGIEKSLDKRSGVGGAIPTIIIASGELNGIQNVKTTLSDSPSKTYTTPLLPRDSQYTFYLSPYPSLTPVWSGDLTIYYNSESNSPALELTFIMIDSVTPPVIKYIIQDNGIVGGNGGSFLTPSAGTSLEGISFSKKYKLTGVANAKLLIVRILGGSSKLGFEGTSDLYKQAETISSEAKTTTNVVKKVELRQSYPQIPAEFFTTSF